VKKKIVLALLLAAAAAGTAFAQKYVTGDGFKYMTSAVDNTYRVLTIQTSMGTQWPIDNGIILLVRSVTAGDPKIVEIVQAYKQGDKSFQSNKKKWTNGEKTTVEEIKKDPNNAAIYRIKTGSGYFVEFATWSNKDIWTKVSNRKFGVILPNSSVLVTENQIMEIESGAIGWDGDFQAASNLDEYMEYLARKVDYKWLAGMVDPLKKKFANAGTKCPADSSCPCKGDINEHIIINATIGAAGWGALWGLAPPWLMPAEFVKVQAQYTAQAYLAAAIGYNYDKLPKGGDAFIKQLKIDNYVLFAGMDENSYSSDSTKGMGESAVTETVIKASEKIMGKIAPKGLSAVPVVGTVWSVGKGAYDGAKDAQTMGRRAVKYYNNMPEFSFRADTGAVTRYNGKGTNVKVPAVIDKVQVKIIGENAFANNQTIESITLDNNTRTIEAGAFMNCSKLTTVNIQKTAIQMNFGDNAFKGTKLTDAAKAKLRDLGYTGEGVGEELFTVTFMVPNGSPVKKTAYKNNTVTFPNNPTKTGFTFVEWNTKSDGTGAAFTASTKVTGNATVYPKWKENAAQPAAQSTQPAQPAKKTYNIGDTGPNGGIVFAAGKECSKDLGPVVWSEADKLVKGLGSGWNMPTKSELNAMYNNLQKKNMGNFKKDSYWAKNGNSAYAQNFGSGADNNSPNTGEKKYVRAVRNF
jgi:uncharacterized repeat protein (TIGR02543 family)